MKGSRWLFLFFVDGVLLCFACVATLCALELVHQSDVFYGSVLQVYCYCVVQFNLRRSQWNGCAKAVSKGTWFSAVVSCDSALCFAGHCWQIALGLLHHGCDLNVIGMCTKHCGFSGKRRFRCGEKLARVCVTVFGCRRLAAESMLDLRERSGTKGLQVTFSLLSWRCAIVFCLCCDTLCIGTGASKRCVLQLVCCNSIYCVVPFSLCRSQWDGCDKVSSKGTWSAVAVVRTTIVFCNLFLADRIGTATSWMRFEC